MIKAIGFDADDTLWHNETHFQDMQRQLTEIIVGHTGDPDQIDAHLMAVERRNLRKYGYGAKGFALSMIETALELTEQRVSGAEIAHIIAMVQRFLDKDVHLLDGVIETLSWVRGRYPCFLITKGDEIEQREKLAKSKLRPFFKEVHVVLEKDPDMYRSIVQREGLDPGQFLMVGNSVRSDILPVLAIGGEAVHIPYEVTWKHEQVEPSPEASHRFATLSSIRDLPAFLEGGLRAPA
ncbi:HAD family hydrolase [Pararhodospirillum oryzae]|uniref:Haloacid dehalogenase n=1 Tax=Pararhodospirillum oryzae TaxID=478448 RepID=A0A512H6L4_9PROT|nr:HAD family hydrolase [Pararhodospirillum oryzae]GEO81068.1 haloacid dehalogenase [Pararhodospirillum oryzae]